jgi:glycosyltransferase involved in cell wall biosynthesis
MTKIGSKITGNKISAIIIAKDEEDKIVDCLKSISWCDEIILVDTGSTDKTVVLAKKAKRGFMNIKVGVIVIGGMKD